ncbi:hypothetical protein BV25DRAFT_324414 [Artomyces pyxidatus]|uniref:Uncharacterized protein n=1 Tax=Artomyces pyxidatus TaxID=48021 RepID=A0ACB8T5C3_9AGAM|nr:hypothetical protein BV25DRAFT_324414 [Artomyces pyxidatus]
MSIIAAPDPFRAYLIDTLSILEQGPYPAIVQTYEGPSDWQTDAIVRSLKAIAGRMYNAAAGGGANSAILDEGAQDTQAPTSEVNALHPEAVPAASPSLSRAGPAKAGVETGAAEELRLVQTHLADITRVLNAITRGDLTQEVTTSVQDVAMLQLKDAVNGTAAQLRALTTEISRVMTEVVGGGYLGGQLNVSGAGGTWLELICSINAVSSTFTRPWRDLGSIVRAVLHGDLSQRAEFEARGEFWDTKQSFNALIDLLGEIVSDFNRATLEYGTQGVLGGQVKSGDRYQGEWAHLTRNFNSMNGKLADQVREISESTQAVAQGDFSRAVEVNAQGEMLVLKDTVNGMRDNFSALVSEMTRIAREYGVEGRFGGQGHVAGVDGMWKDLVDSLNLMAENVSSAVDPSHRVQILTAQFELPADCSTAHFERPRPTP